MRVLEITATGEGRLDAFLASSAKLGLSRSRVQALIRDGRVTVAGRVPKAKDSLQPGDLIRVEIPDPEPVDLAPEQIPLDVVYEDKDLIVINKARGMVVHPAAGHAGGTLVNALLDHVDDLEGIGGELRPGIVHRLDKDTTGLLVAAKNETAHRALSDQIREHTARRIYWALVHGDTMPDAGRVEAPIGRHPVDRKRMAVNTRTGKTAITHFRTLERFRGYALLECRLETGRTHQIRVHLAYIGHPVVSDPVYGTRKPRLGLPPQALHARQLGIFHPRSGEWMEFTAELPPEIVEAIQQLRG